MSWEGFDQCICDNGHFFCGESYCYEEPNECPICKSKIAWRNQVDDTNCDSWGEIPIGLLQKHFLVTPEKNETCNLGHSHIVEHAIYRVPTKKETDPLRHRREHDGRSQLIPIDSEDFCSDKKIRC